MALDPTFEPALNFTPHPANGTQSDAHAARKSARCLKLVDHGATQSRDLAHLGKPKNLQEGGACQGFCIHEWVFTALFRAIADKSPPATSLVPTVSVEIFEFRREIPQNPDGQAPTIAKSP